jgi:hypothetical protein
VTRDAAFGVRPGASRQERLVAAVSGVLAVAMFEDQEALFEERPDVWRERFGEVRRFVEDEVAAGRIPGGDLDVSCIRAGERFGEIVSNEQAMVLHERERDRLRERHGPTAVTRSGPDLRPERIDETVRRQPELREGLLDWVARARREAVAYAVYEAVRSALWLDRRADNEKPRPVISTAARWAGVT